jgi:hypothetical protein
MMGNNPEATLPIDLYYTSATTKLDFPTTVDLEVEDGILGNGEKGLLKVMDDLQCDADESFYATSLSL